MPKVTMSTPVAMNADALWQAMGSFAAIGNWHPMMEKVEAEGEKKGSMRTLQLIGGAKLVERLEEVSPTERLYRYSIIESPLPISNYFSEIRVKDNGDGTSTVEWSSDFEVNTGKRDRRGQDRAGGLPGRARQHHQALRLQALTAAAPTAGTLAMRSRFWRGGLPLGEAFWLWGILGGAVANLFVTLLVVMLLTSGVPTWLVALMFTAHMPLNLCCWSVSGAAPGGRRWSRNARSLARVAMALGGGRCCLCLVEVRWRELAGGEATHGRHRDVLAPGHLELDRLAAWLDAEPPVRIGARPGCVRGSRAAAALVAQAAAGEAAVYGVNTGFGKLARVRIPAADIAELQRRLVLSHMCGVGRAGRRGDGPAGAAAQGGEPGPRALGRAAGHDRRAVASAGPRCPAGDPGPGLGRRLGRSGAPGPCRRGADRRRPDPARRPRAAGGRGTGRDRAGAARPAAKEGLALLNGTQVSTALAITGLLKARRLFDAALVAGAMCTDAALGSDTPFDPRIQRARNQPGQAEVAAHPGGPAGRQPDPRSHVECERVQDPYSVRCQPQVMGAVRDSLPDAAVTLEREANGVSDNPLVFVEEGEILSGGNFHAEPVAFAADRIAVAMAEIGNLAERRIALLTDSSQSSLPAFLTPSPASTRAS